MDKDGRHIMPGDKPCPYCGCPYGAATAGALWAARTDPLIAGLRRFVVVASLFALVLSTASLVMLHIKGAGWWAMIGVALGIFGAGHALGNVTAQMIHARRRP